MEPHAPQIVCFGEVLWDILPSGPLPGGAPMNVAYHLKKLGADASLITKVGQDTYGKDLVDMLEASGINTGFVGVDDQHPTGLVYANISNRNEVSYDIVYPSAWDFIEWSDRYTDLLHTADYFIYGSLAARSKESRETLYQLLEIANTKVLDINLRPPHFQKDQLEYLMQQADMVKMNKEELEHITEWYSRFQSMEDRMLFLQDRFNLTTLIVTMGGEGAMAGDKGIIFYHPGYKVTVADTIGSGDSFLAGFLHQQYAGATVEASLTFASGIGAFIATQQGACPAYELSQITALINSSAAVE